MTLAENSQAADLIVTKTIVDLLEQTSNLAVVKEFLKSKGLRFSASGWAELFDKRISPAVQEFKISNIDLISLLRSAEEHGHQHVFLFKTDTKTASELMDRSRINSTLNKRGLTCLLTEPRVLEAADAPTIVDVRWDSQHTFTIKEVYTRKSAKPLRSEMIDGFLHKIYEFKNQRAVNLAKLHKNRNLEVRLTAQLTSTRYESELTRFLVHIKDFIQIEKFSEVSLSKARNHLWKQRKSLADQVRFSDATVRDDNGNALHASTGNMEFDLSSQEAISNSLDSVLTTDHSTYCSGQNIWLKKSPKLSTDTHVLLNGMVHEFGLPASCGESDYEQVLSQLRHFNK